MLEKIMFYSFNFLGCFILVTFGISAGWIIGSVFIGVIYALYINNLKFSRIFFKIVIGFVGVNIGLLIEGDLLSTVGQFLLPLSISIFVTLFGSMLLSLLLSRYTFIDKKTAFFSCMPGGTSVMIALGEEFKADTRIIVAFHTIRITLFVLLIPFIAGLIASKNSIQEKTNLVNIQGIDYTLGFKILILVGIVFLSIIIGEVIKLPSAPFVFSMLFGFLFNQFIWEVGNLPSFILNSAQVLLGGLIGVRFNKKVLDKLNGIKRNSMIIIGLYVSLSIGVSLLVYQLTSFNLVTSLLSVAPAGAAEMASTAVSLNEDASIVASFQLIRLLFLSVIIPVVITLLSIRKRKVKDVSN